jgi:hypothetical protein
VIGDLYLDADFVVSLLLVHAVFVFPRPIPSLVGFVTGYLNWISTR